MSMRSAQSSEKEKVPADKLNIIADAIFNSVIRYGIAVYLVPMYEKEDLKARKLSSETYDLQVLQNNMLRLIHGLRISNRVNMLELRTEIKIMSVNQMSIYHTIMEVQGVPVFRDFTICDPRHFVILFQASIS